MAGTLSIVSTPIGHLDDITLRALNVLRAADLIAAEDTRRTGKLLAHYGIPTPSISFHEHNSRGRIPELLGQLTSGRTVALVSDAGTPVLSDPGLELVQACISQGIFVDPIPGASAPLALAVVSGFPVIPWTIHGFAPARANDRKRWLEEIVRVPHSLTFFETPHRIAQTLGDLSEFSGSRPIVVARELTKVHQTIYRGTATSLQGEVEPRGELTVMLGPAPDCADLPAEAPSDEQLGSEFGEITESGVATRRAALRELAARHRMSARDVYAALERSKQR